MIFDKLVELLAEQYSVDADTITEETRFVEDLGADSLDMVEMMMAFEEEFDVGEIAQEVAMTLKTVGDVVKFVESQS